MTDNCGSTFYVPKSRLEEAKREIESLRLEIETTKRQLQERDTQLKDAQDENEKLKEDLSVNRQCYYQVVDQRNAYWALWKGKK